MPIKLEFKGADIDEAISQACRKLNVPREELDIEIVSTGSSGIFGLCKKQAVIRAARKPADTIGPAVQAATTEPEPERALPAPSAAPPVVPPATEEKYEQAANNQAPRRARQAVREREKAEAPPPTPPRPLAPLTPEIRGQIKTDLEQLLTLMGFASTVDVEERNNKAHAVINGEHLDELTGNDGQALDSLQYLMRKIIARKFPEKVHFAIDAGEFREKRKIELQELALKLAAEVKETDKTKTTPPLNPAERRVVHLTLQDDKGIRSRSVGDGLFKKIIIYLPGKGRSRPSAARRKGRKN
ncbi:MAG: protein jag [Thermodesulfobacteriota bacterium]